jgi:hypothetical protein
LALSTDVGKAMRRFLAQEDIYPSLTGSNGRRILIQGETPDHKLLSIPLQAESGSDNRLEFRVFDHGISGLVSVDNICYTSNPYIISEYQEDDLTFSKWEKGYGGNTGPNISKNINIGGCASVSSSNICSHLESISDDLGDVPVNILDPGYSFDGSISDFLDDCQQNINEVTPDDCELDPIEACVEFGVGLTWVDYTVELNLCS